MNPLKLFSLCFLLFCCGCATVSHRETLSTYSINGRPYLSLVALCNAEAVQLDFDAFARTIVLGDRAHKIRMMIGESLILVDAEPRRMASAVDLYQGMVVVPRSFKSEIFDPLFRGSRKAPAQAVDLSCIKKIVIDAGHGGNDPGATGKSGLKEKEVTLDIAKRLAALLRAAGVTVVMTRSDDTFVPLASRCEIANKEAADIFLSVHANANPRKRLQGFEVYHISSKVDPAARAVDAAQNFPMQLDGQSFASDTQDLRAIVWDMRNAASRAESVHLSRLLCRQAGRNLDAEILGVKSAGFHVLKGTHMPAVLIEVGFLSNSEEERLLCQGSYRQRLAETIFDALKSYAKEYTVAEAQR